MSAPNATPIWQSREERWEYDTERMVNAMREEKRLHPERFAAREAEARRIYEEAKR